MQNLIVNADLQNALSLLHTRFDCAQKQQLCIMSFH